MDYVLRRGETFTRWWTPRGGRWNHHPSYHQGAKKRILERKPLGPKCKHASFSVHGMGNGRFVYQPDLTNAADVADGKYDAENIKVDPAKGIVLGGAGEAHVVFEVRSPYVIVPRVNEYESTEDDTEASIVEVDADGAELSVSTDNGLTWTKVAAAGGKVDLTPQVARRYGYLLKVAASGKAAGAVVRSLKITTWVQLHPASLPTLAKGVNKMQYVSGDHHGLESRVVEIRTSANAAEDFLKWCSEPPKDFDAARKTSRARGRFVVKVPAPPGTKIAWFSGGGNFQTHQAGNAPKTANTMAWAADEPKDFKQFYRARIPADQGHWHYNADVEVKLPKPAKTVFLEYVGRPAVNNLRIFAHCVEDRPLPTTPVVITHKWLEGGAEKTRTVTMSTDAGSYEITCGADPKDVSVEMSVPSSGK